MAYPKQSGREKVGLVCAILFFGQAYATVKVRANLDFMRLEV